MFLETISELRYLSDWWLLTLLRNQGTHQITLQESPHDPHDPTRTPKQPRRAPTPGTFHKSTHVRPGKSGLRARAERYFLETGYSDHAPPRRGRDSARGSGASLSAVAGAMASTGGGGGSSKGPWEAPAKLTCATPRWTLVTNV